MPNKNSLLKFILLVGDVILMYSALLLSLGIRYGDFSFLPGPQTKIFLFHFSFIHVFWLLFLFALDFYEVSILRRISDFYRNLIVFFVMASATGIAYFYLVPELTISPKTILVADILIFVILFCVWRYCFSRILVAPYLKERIVIIGFRPELGELLRHYLSRNGYEIVAFFNPNSSLSNELISFSNLAKWGIISDISRLKEIIEKEGINSIIFASDPHKNGEMIQEIFTGLPLKLNYISFDSFYENLTKKVPTEAIDKVWFLENLSRPERKIDQAFKRVFDILFSFLGLLITVILFPFVALATELDSPGFIFYSQRRVGKDGKNFTLYKFRTMKADAEKTGPQWALPNDPRITRVGRILRAIHVDEFPQFYNIFKGDISFVGPRPERPEFVDELKKEIPYYEIRHLIKPGFTGWAQINYKYSASVEEAKEKLRYELYYIKNRSFLLDLGIILKTIRIILR